MYTADSNVILAAMRARMLPAVGLLDADDSSGVAPAQLGGAPSLADDVAWPAYRGRPLAFIAQMDCAALRAAGGPAWLPACGMLFFFYDVVEQPWGFDPAHRGSWAVIHDPRGPSAERRAQPAGVVDERGDVPVATPQTLLPMQSLPSLDRLEVDIDPRVDSATIDDIWDVIEQARDADTYRGQVGGYPNPVQQDTMELQCQLASNGIYIGNSDGYASDEARRLGPGAAEWRLLLELASFDDEFCMWGDGGSLYFWIREDDTRAGRWDAAWLILQCG